MRLRMLVAFLVFSSCLAGPRPVDVPAMLQTVAPAMLEPRSAEALSSGGTTLRATNYALSRYTGKLTCGMAATNVPAGAGDQTRFVPIDTTHCREVAFGPRHGYVREVDLLVDLQPGESVEIRTDQLVRDGVPRVDIGDPSRFGRPAIQVADALFPLPMVDARISGSTVLAHFAGRVDQPFFDLWVDFDPAAGWGRWECLTTVANPSVSSPSLPIQSEITLTWQDAETVVLLAGNARPVLFAAGDSIAQGQARAQSGVVGWTRLLSTDAYASFAGAALGAVCAVDTGLLSPIGLARPGLSSRAPSPLSWANSYFARARDNQGPGWERIWNLGWQPASTSTGDQEDQGGNKGGIALLEPGAGQVDYYLACEWARKPCHWLEVDGSMLNSARFPGLILYAGMPHWHHGVSPDWLGMSSLPTQLQTHGYYGPDQSHWFCNRLWSATSATCSPMLQRLCEHQAQLVLFGVTLNSRWSTTTTGESRGLGWQSLIMANLIRTLESDTLRAQVQARALDWLEQIVVPWLQRPAGAQQILYDYPITDRRGGIDLSYASWWSCWQQGIGSFGLYVLATMPEIAQARPSVAAAAREIAVRSANLIVDAGITQVDATTLVVWDTMGIRADGQPLTPAEVVEGVGAHTSGFFRSAWVPLGVWVAAREGHARAREVYMALQAEQLDGTADMDWFPPLE